MHPMILLHPGSTMRPQLRHPHIVHLLDERCTASHTLAASALVWRFEVPEATITRSNSGERCSVSKTWMSCALTSSSPSMMGSSSSTSKVRLLRFRSVTLCFKIESLF